MADESSTEDAVDPDVRAAALAEMAAEFEPGINEFINTRPAEPKHAKAKEPKPAKTNYQPFHW